MFHVVCINDRTGVKEYLSAARMTHDEACVFLRKMLPYNPRFPYIRRAVEPAPDEDHPLGCPECGSRGRHDFNGDTQDPTYCCANCKTHFDECYALYKGREVFS